MTKYYAMYIPTGDTIELFCDLKTSAKRIIVEADFYYVSIKSIQKLSYTYYKNIEVDKLCGYIRTYIDKSMNSSLFELIEKEE